MTQAKWNDGVTAGEALKGRADIGPSAADLEDPDFCDGLASVVFNCDGCGWWCPADEAHEGHDGGMLCSDCLTECSC